MRARHLLVFAALAVACVASEPVRSQLAFVSTSETGAAAEARDEPHEDATDTLAHDAPIAGVESAPIAAVESAPSAPERAEEDEETEALSRPERQWRWIAQAADASCRDALAATKADFVALPDVAEPNAAGCGIPRGVLLKRGVTGMRYSPPVRVDCSFALRLGEIERIFAEEVNARFGAKVARIGHVGTYVCRGVVGRLRGRSGGISEHSFGNAIDVTHLDLDSGKRLSVLHHYRNESAAVRDHRALLHDVYRRVRRETDLRALGPDFDASHRSHFHFDAGSRWWRW